MTDTQRRRLLKSLLLIASASSFPAALAAAAQEPAIVIDPARFPQSLASGDPQPDGMLLWTRAPAQGTSQNVRVQLAEDSDFQHLRVDQTVPAEAANDWCIKLRVRGLDPGRKWYYRFLVDAGNGLASSPLGRTCSAPHRDQAATLQLALLSCQDYSGRWYNTLLPLLDMDLDLLVHVGDFIYETLGDPGFQEREGERVLQFEDVDGALHLGTAEQGFHAAHSLANYRQLHRAYRSDPVLQRLLERTPLLAIWDDHEFADDSWQASATHHAGRRDEHDPQRKRNAEQAYFEYLPVDLQAADVPGSTLPVDPATLWPETRLWRGLSWGRDIELLLTDYRSHRPDHLIPEDAFPGALAIEQAPLQAMLQMMGITMAQARSWLTAYLDLGDQRWQALREPLRTALEQRALSEGADASTARALAAELSISALALDSIRLLLNAGPENSEAAERWQLPDEDELSNLPHGLSWQLLGKTQWFSSVGSRYFVVKDSFDLYARWLAAQHGPSRQNAFGELQDQWLQTRLRESSARWKLLASSVSFTSLVLDLSHPELQAPAAMQRNFYLNLDQWDGFPAQRERYLRLFDETGGVVLLSGDIHSSFACQHGQRTVEFTTPAVSSTPLSTILRRYSDSNDPAAQRMVDRLAELFQLSNTGLAYCQTTRHGVTVIDIGEDAVNTTFHELPEHLARSKHYNAPEALTGERSSASFRVDRQGRLTRV